MSRLHILALAALALAAPARGDDFQDLFNGKDLSGWEGDPKLWSVKDGMIVGETDGKIPDNSFLLWKGTAADFELRAKFRLHGGNSGIQYRSKHLTDRPGFVVAGYQADMDADNRYTGILYEEKARGILAQRGEKVVIAANGDRYVVGRTGDPAKLAHDINTDGWNDYVIVATGNKLTHTINGALMVEVVDHQADKRAADGIIALQLHRGFKMAVEFKDIKLKKLPAGKILTPEDTPIPPGARKVGAPTPRPRPTRDQPQQQRPAGPLPPAADHTPRPLSKTVTKWIWLGPAENNQTVYLRRDFTLRGGSTAARLYAAGDDRVAVYLDGKEVAQCKDWSKPAFKDVTADLGGESNPRIKGGRHVLAARGYNSRGKAGVLVRLVVESANGEPVAVATDETWRASTKEAAGWNELNFDDSAWAAATVAGNLGDRPWNRLTDATLAAAAGVKITEPPATLAESLKVAKGFRVELLYSVPKGVEGSWVNMCVDPQGRLIVSDQYGGLYRVTPPPVGGKPEQTKVEKIPAAIGEAQGLVWAFDSLYVVVNRGQKYASGLYRVRSSQHDDRLDSVELLRKLSDGGGEHGPHAVVLAPDGQSLYVVCGNKTSLTELAGSRVPRVWGEDHLLPRMPDGRGFMRGVLGPGGSVYKVDPDGKSWELVCTGFRNPFDLAFNRHGDLFTYDADMEWDFNTPWYRPTRVCLVASGGEYGWRNGAGKWPPYYPDSLPPIHEVGPGSPTGLTFGYGAKFPAKYQEALFMCDWSYGKLYALHLTPAGSSYTGEREEFVTGTPLPLTDVVINPHDGAMYFTIGGRRTKSGLYRVTYTGPESTSPTPPAADAGAELRAVRRTLESFHGHRDPAAVEVAWPYLGHPDRFIRFAARVAIEWQNPAEWRERALAETEPLASLNALLALIRVSAPDPFHRKPTDPPADPALRARVLESLARLDWDRLDEPRRLDLLRVYAVLFNRLGRPEESERQAVLDRLDPHFPARERFVNAELCQLLVYLEAPFIVPRALALMADAPTQEEQIEYAKSLRVFKGPWTIDQRKEYFAWLQKAHGYRGGASFAGFLKIIRDDAVATLTPTEKELLGPMLDPKPVAAAPTPAKQRPFVRHYTVAELAPVVEKGLTGRDFDRGRKLFGEATCFACHRYDNEGGAQGPDLTQSVGRFSPRDLLESIVEPSKEVSDQYAAVTVTTTDGRVITGRIVNLAGDSISLLTNLLDPTAIVKVDRKLIESQAVSKVSMMPEGLLDTFAEDEVLDLVAYLLSRGDRRAAMFRK